jgi:hypothetical protein
MTAAELAPILAAHAEWLADNTKGKRANLTEADLSRADLTVANLTEANLTEADLTRANLTEANLRGANLTEANLTGANLSWANLTGAYLTGADLTRANLTGADLTGADLTGADLSGANLTRATGIIRERHVDLLMLLDQPGPIRAYKLVTANGESPIHEAKLRYEIGATIEQPDANTDPNEPCGAGIHVATLPWVLREWKPGFRVLLVEFCAADIACIPTATDGKFRLHRCTVVGEKDVSAWVTP